MFYCYYLDGYQMVICKDNTVEFFAQINYTSFHSIESTLSSCDRGKNRNIRTVLRKKIKLHNDSYPFFWVLILKTIFINFRIQSEYRKIRTRKTPYWDTFHAVNYWWIQVNSRRYSFHKCDEMQMNQNALRSLSQCTLSRNSSQHH